MSFVQTVILGGLAGVTIYLGLPLGRLTGLSAKTRTFLSMASTGILLFLLFEVFSHVAEPIEDLLLAAPSTPGGYARFGILLFTFAFGFSLGLFSLIAFERSFIKSHKTAELPQSPFRLSLMIAGGIGLHNFSEGLAIGQSSGQVELTLATLLVIGFALHNATEGFGIVGPLAGQRPSWKFLALLGLIGGGPTLVGSMLGYYFVSPLMFTLSLSVAAGALVYIIGEMFRINHNSATRAHAAGGLILGLLIAFSTELILAVAGL